MQEHAGAGHLLAGALEEGGAGGAIVATAGSRAAVEAWIAADPFIINGAFECDLREYSVAFAAPGVEGLQD